MNRARNTMPGNNTNGNNRMNGTNGMNGNMMPDNRMNGMNGTKGNRMNGMNGNGVRGAALTGTLAEQIRALCFVKVELELYLDTHPRCRTALDYYHRTVDELKRLTEEYENTVGPLTAKGVTDTENWTWVDGPWPWQQAGDFMREGDR